MDDIKVNMKKIFKIPLFIIAVLIVLCVLLFLSYILFFKDILEQTVVVDTPLSINYLDSQSFDEGNNKNINFSVTNDGSEVVYYEISFSKVVSSSDISFNIAGDNDLIIDGIIEEGNVHEPIAISPQQTHDYILNVDYQPGDVLKGQLNVQKYLEEDMFFKDTILSLNTLNEATTKVGSEVAILDEGLIKNEDTNGLSYFFRGASSSNYVNFANFTWRIVKINSDGSIKLILDGDLSDNTSYYIGTSSSDFVGSNVNEVLTSWYSQNLNLYTDIITNHKFCSDNSLVNNNQTFAAYNRASVDMIATYECLGTLINSKIGLLTVDEVMFAGGSVTADNTSYYLKNDDVETSFYLMSGAKESTSYYPFVVSSQGKIESTSLGSLVRSVRPVINIDGNVEVDGIGTVDNPFIIVN